MSTGDKARRRREERIIHACAAPAVTDIAVIQRCCWCACDIVRFVGMPWNGEQPEPTEDSVPLPMPDTFPADTLIRIINGVPVQVLDRLADTDVLCTG